eukprot:6181935-Pleurochrysis_carterae.AAC.2
MRVDHHRVCNGERVAVDDETERRVEQLHPLMRHQAQPRVLCDPRTVPVQFGHDEPRFPRLVHTLGRFTRIKPVADPVGDVVTAAGATDSRSDAPLVQRDDVTPLPKLEWVVRVQKHLLLRAAVKTHHHGQVRQHRENCETAGTARAAPIVPANTEAIMAPPGKINKGFQGTFIEKATVMHANENRHPSCQRRCYEVFICRENGKRSEKSQTTNAVI